jgi:hypothetical protein
MENPKRFPEKIQKPIYVDMRSKREWRPTDIRDIEVEDQSSSILDQHVADGFYSKGIKFFGISPDRNIAGRRSPNCYDKTYMNVFIDVELNFYHVYILQP